MNGIRGLYLLKLAFIALCHVVAALGRRNHGADDLELLRDDPIVGAGSLRYLDGTWMLWNANKSLQLQGQVPGDVISDLEAAGQIRDPYHENNFRDKEQKSMWYQQEWVYSRTLEAPASGAALLVFEGVKMSATVRFDGEVVGVALDQFLRYSWPVNVTAGKTHDVSVTFDWQTIDARWMGCSGGWDWAPYTDAKREGTTSFSYGIWKSVYIILPESSGSTRALPAAEPVAPTYVAHFAPQVHYDMSNDYRNYPATPMMPHKHRDFFVVAKVVVAHAAALQLTAEVSGEWGGKNMTTFSIPAPKKLVNGLAETVLQLRVPAKAQDIELWWPNGMGKQKLYNVTAKFTDVTGGRGVVLGTASRLVGFKFLALVTGNDADPEYVKQNFGKEGTDIKGMAFRVNGALILSRGSNLVPMEELEARMSAKAYQLLVRSAADAGMNTIRIWGGGIFAPRAFYSECDQRGILIYHDMMYALFDHLPKATPMQDAELRYQVRRLSHHASIGIWDGCNECSRVMKNATGIFPSFVLGAVVEEDASHPVWPAAPSNGWEGGVEKLTSLPIAGKALATRPQLPQMFFETHGPYQHGNDRHGPFDTVNMGQFIASHNPYPPKISTDAVGLSVGATYASEYGTSVMTSFESLAPTLDSRHWALYAGMSAGKCNGGSGQTSSCKGDNPMQQRNYGATMVLKKYFGSKSISQEVMNTTGEGQFKRALYLAMLSQALEVKSEVESRRSRNTYGLLQWQLNEVWPTGGWGSLEYGSADQEGVVIGGRWKPVHYYNMKFLFHDVMLACGQEAKNASQLVCTVKNNKNTALEDGLVSLEFLDITGRDKHARSSVNVPAAVPADGGAVVFPLHLPPEVAAATHIIRANLSATCTENAKTLITAVENIILLTYPHDMQIDKSAVVNVRIDGPTSADPVAPIGLTVSSTGTALFVHLTTLAHGRFSDNSFIIAAIDGPKRVLFYPFVPDQESSLRSSLRFEYLNMYADVIGEDPMHVDKSREDLDPEGDEMEVVIA